LNTKYLEKISKINSKYLKHFENVIFIDENLSRKIVSFQANKDQAFHKWYKYKEAFSIDLVNYFLTTYKFPKGRILDPFAGIGTTLFSSSDFGYDSVGIELLPIGESVINAGNLARNGDTEEILNALIRWKKGKYWEKSGEQKEYQILRITQYAYSEETDNKIKRYLFEIDNESKKVRDFLFFALLCILENISYTRKDGQYLRWDSRSMRNLRSKPFNKGRILSFDEAIEKKFSEIINDLSNRQMTFDFDGKNYSKKKGEISLLRGSTLEIINNFDSNTFSGIITSPPYCNRYDYTRTYALELAMLGINEEEIKTLRQTMLSCTVENREKDLLAINPKWEKAVRICDENKLLKAILDYLEYMRNSKKLNNSGIFRMVKGYFYEMACIIQESYRILDKNCFFVMVNDNVRFAGVSISVDLILSSIAESIGYNIESILVLPNGKGNSSQQMGKYGRDILRKCVYIWKRGN